MKVELEINDDLLWLGENDEDQIPVYSVRCIKSSPYKDQDNYLCHREVIEELSAASIRGLYEQMGKMVVDHMIHGEKENKRDPWEHPLDEFIVEFSNIYVEVETYDKERMKASEEYKNIGAAKEAARAREAAEKAKEEERVRKWRIRQQEIKDREDYERLRKKFGIIG